MPQKRTIPRVCCQCGADFLAKAATVKIGYGLYCTRSCHFAALRNPIPRVCEQCGTDFLALAYEVKIGRARYCSRPCQYSGLSRPSDIEICEDGIVRIPLLKKDGTVRAYAVIDAADAEWAGTHRWHLNDNGYAVRHSRGHGRDSLIALHRELLGLATGDERDGDHINRDKLDNRRSNLRILPKGANPQNVPSYRGASSAYRGVGWRKDAGAWVATVKINGKKTYLGYFTDELEAAEAARAARTRLMPYAVD